MECVTLTFLKFPPASSTPACADLSDGPAGE